MKLYTIREVAEITKINIETIRRFIREGDIIAYKLGREWRVKEEDLLEFIDKGVNHE